jgi:hypothetical protein
MTTIKEHCMPDSFGKRQRDQVKARKAAARDERRVARTKRRRDGSPPTWLDAEPPIHDTEPNLSPGAPAESPPFAG